MQTSSEREADRALKRQVDTIISVASLLTNRQSANACGVCPNVGGQIGGKEGSLFVLSLKAMLLNFC